VFGLATVVSLAGTGGQLYFSFQDEKQRIVSTLDDLEDIQLNTLSNLVWNMDVPAIQIVLDGVLEVPDIIYVEVSDEFSILYTAGRLPELQSGLISRQYPLIKNIGGAEKTFGSVLFVATTANVKSTLLENISKSLLLQLVVLFFTCFIILILFIKLFNIHINRIVQYTETLEVGTMNQRLELDRAKRSGSQADEIDHIVNAINTMRESLQAEIEVQRKTEIKLVYEKQFSDVIINSIPGLLFILDENVVPVRYNRTFQEMANISDDNIDQVDLFEMVSFKDREKLKNAISKVKNVDESLNLEVCLITGYGKEIPYIITMQRLFLDQKPMVVGMATDLSERKLIEEQLRQSQKMEAIGTLAGGIAHDFNNILAAIIGYLNLVQLVTAADSPSSSYLQEIEKASMRAKDLVAQILTFSRKKESEKRPLPLKPILKEALKLLRSSIPTSIDIRQNIMSDQCVVSDATEIHQIVMNLCTNAYHAMEKSGGILEVSLTDRLITSLDYIDKTELIPGQYVQLSVSDSGTGMDEEIVQKIFEPYYTTKETGKGTGLGLAVVHGIVTQCKGGIYVYSRPGKGTIFNIFLPVASDSTFADKMPDVTEMPINLYGHGRIMVVDDDRSILMFIKELLTLHGYTVEAFESADRAFDYFQTNPAAVDLVLTDLTMPGMSGIVFGESVLAIRKELPVIIMSGFSLEFGRQDFLDKTFADFMNKPVSSVELLSRIRVLLRQDSDDRRTMEHIHN
jgi:PAS domain S-box-containing protein